MPAVPFAGPLKINQLDPDLQACVRELPLTTLEAFQASARQIRAAQEARWASRGRDDPRMLTAAR